MQPAFPGVEVVSSVDQVAAGSVDCLTVLEVCEHLDQAETDELLARVLRPGGTLLVTVPIVIGPVILLKEAARMLLFRRRTDLSMRELLACALWGAVPRRADNIKHSHRGYDWRITRRLLDLRVGPVRTVFSPFRWFGPWLNSQALLAVVRG